MSRHSTDLLADCVRSLEEKLHERVDPSSVTSQVCGMCRNPTCKRAGWADSQWQHRMDTQVDRLLDNPQFSDLVLPRHLMVHQEEWADISRKAMKLDIAARRGDWIPVTDDDLPSDGRLEVSSEQSANAVDLALEALAKKKGKKRPQVPRLVGGVEDPTTNGTPKISEGPPMSPEAQKKVEQMAESLGLSVEQDEQSEVESKPKSSPKPKPPKSPPQAMPGNTPVPREGIMVDGGPPSSQPTADPWAPKKERVVKPHSTVRMGVKDE